MKTAGVLRYVLIIAVPLMALAGGCGGDPTTDFQGISPEEFVGDCEFPTCESVVQSAGEGSCEAACADIFKSTCVSVEVGRLGDAYVTNCNCASKDVDHLICTNEWCCPVS